MVANTTQRPASASEKVDAIHQEVYNYHKDMDAVTEAERYGHKKTDKTEIRLVRKLDRYIMPVLWIM